MYAVHFFENRNLLLSQLRQQVPSVNENVKIKGRKAVVSNVESIEENKIHVQVVVEIPKQNKQVADNSKRKKGK